MLEPPRLQVGTTKNLANYGDPTEDRTTGIFPITDFARAMYENIRVDPAQNDAVMRWLAEKRRQQFVSQGLLDH